MTLRPVLGLVGVNAALVVASRLFGVLPSQVALRGGGEAPWTAVLLAVCVATAVLGAAARALPARVGAGVALLVGAFAAGVGVCGGGTGELFALLLPAVVAGGVAVAWTAQPAG